MFFSVRSELSRVYVHLHVMWYLIALTFPFPSSRLTQLTNCLTTQLFWGLKYRGISFLLFFLLYFISFHFIYISIANYNYENVSLVSLEYNNCCSFINLLNLKLYIQVDEGAPGRWAETGVYALRLKKYENNK